MLVNISTIGAPAAVDYDSVAVLQRALTAGQTAQRLLQSVQASTHGVHTNSMPFGIAFRQDKLASPIW